MPAVKTKTQGGMRTWESLVNIFAAHQADAYAALARACTDDPQLAGDAPPLLVLHAVRLAALQGRATDPWHGDVAAFRRDCASLAGEITAAAKRDLVQFTDSQRLTDLLPGFFFAAARYPGLPVRLVEIGASAGLLLAPERYSVRYPRCAWTPADAAAALQSELDVPPALLQRELRIVDRIGIDLAPVNLRADTTVDYLRSFVWPGDPAREARLRAACAALAADPPPLLAGNAAAMLPGVLAERVAPDVLTVVVESAAAHYLTGTQNMHLGMALDCAAAHGPLVLVTRGGLTPGPHDLPYSVKVIDLSRPWRCVYAACDALSERTAWVAHGEGTA